MFLLDFIMYVYEGDGYNYISHNSVEEQFYKQKEETFVSAIEVLKQRLSIISDNSSENEIMYEIYEVGKTF